MTNELYHHGILGQKWGVRRYQNADGSLTAAGKKKQYKSDLKTDKRIRQVMESAAYDSSRIANLYYNKSKSYSKKYEKALAKDPTKSKKKTVKMEKTKNNLDTKFNSWNTYNSQNMKHLKEHVDNMINKYSKTKIKNVKSYTVKNGIEYVKSVSASMESGNALYNLKKYRRDGYDDYVPVKRSFMVY